MGRLSRGGRGRKSGICSVDIFVPAGGCLKICDKDQIALMQDAVYFCGLTFTFTRLRRIQFVQTSTNIINFFHLSYKSNKVRL